MMKVKSLRLTVRAVLLLAALPCVAHGEWPVLKTYEGEFLRRVKMPLGGIPAALLRWKVSNPTSVPIRDIRSRYDGRKRSPFDEAECGHHYARALAAWSVFRAWGK